MIEARTCRRAGRLARARGDRLCGCDAPLMDSHNMTAVKEAFRALTEDGMDAGVESLLSIAHDDCCFRPYSAEGRVLKGAEEVRTHYRDTASSGTGIQVRPSRFAETGPDEVTVTGSVRVVRPAGGFAETQVRWIYRFRDGLLEDATWGPREGENGSTQPVIQNAAQPNTKTASTGRL